MSLFHNGCAAALSLALFAGQLSAATAPYCVHEIGVVRSPAKGIASQSHGPTKFLFGGEAATPLAIDEVREPAEDANHYYVRTVLWTFGKDGHFHGPYAAPGFQNAVTDGRSIYFRGYDHLPAKDAKTPDWPKLFVVENGGEAHVIGGPVARAGWASIFDRPVKPGQWPIVKSFTIDQKGPQQQEYFLIDGNRPVAVGRDRIPPEYRFNRWGAGVTAEYDTVRLHHLRTWATKDLELHHTDDFPDWESANVDRYGWLFVEGYGNDYAIKLRSTGASIEADRVVRYTGRGFWGRVFEWILGMNRGTHVNETYWSAQCVDYSPILQLTLFCKPVKVLREGELKRVGDGSVPLDRYIGDSTGHRLALFRGKDGSLYAFNGDDVQFVAANVGRFPTVQDLPPTGRTFVTSGKNSWELVGRFPNLSLRAIRFSRSNGHGAPFECCLSLHGMSQARFVAFPGTPDVLAFSTLFGVWRLDNARAEFLWPTMKSEIDLDSISPAAVWNGMVFSTMDRRNYLLRKCG